MTSIHSHQCCRHQLSILFFTFTVIISFIVIFVAVPTLQHQHHVDLDDDHDTISGEDFRRQRAAKAAVDQAKKQQKNRKQQQQNKNSFIEINNHEEFIKTERLRSKQGTDTPRSQQQQQHSEKIKNQAVSDRMKQRLEEKRNRFMKSSSFSSSSKSQTGAEEESSTRRGRNGGSSLLQRPSRGDGVSDPFIVNLQENAAPRINFNAPNFFLPSKITHLVEFEIVKAWRSVLVDLEKAFDGHEDDFDIERDEDGKFLRAVPKKNSSDGITSSIQKNNLEMMQKNLRNETWVREKGALVSNVTHWEVVGHTLVALFGEEEPELVQQFIQTTEKGYRSENNNTMADSFYGALPFISSAARERQRQKIERQQQQHENVDNFFFDGHFVAAKALPKELRHGFNDNDESTYSSSSSSFLTARPPWAERSRWVMSGNYQNSVAGFTFVDMESKRKQTKNKRENENNKKIDDSSSQEEEDLEQEKQQRHRQKSSSSSSSPLTLRPGSLLHRDCDDNNNNNKNVFSWYALTSRQIAQILHTNELKEEADKAFQEDKNDHNNNHIGNNNDRRRRRPDRTIPVDEEFLEKVHQLHEMTKNDRIFGQVLTGYPHFERLGNLPQHGKLFAHHHYLNRTKQQKQQSSSSYIDEHPEEYFSPFVDGIPMQHVSISRASVYEMKYNHNHDENTNIENEDEHEKNSFFYNFLKNQRQSSPHAKPSPEISDYIEPREGGTAKEGNILLSKNLKPEERQEIVRRRFDKISEWDKKNDQLWRKYSFGRSISPFDLESDVRFARSEFTLKCPREFGLAKKLYRQELLSENEDENKLTSFIRFTGGVPPLPNCTEAAILWQWCNYRNQKVVQAALHQRVARDPILREHANDARRQERLVQKERVAAAEEDRRERRRRSRSASSSSSSSSSSVVENGDSSSSIDDREDDDSSSTSHHKDFVAQEMGRRKQKKNTQSKNPFHLEDIESSSLKRFASDLKQKSATNEAEFSSTMNKAKQNAMLHAKQKQQQQQQQQQQQRQKKQSGGSKSRDKMYSNVRVASEDLDEATQEEVNSRNSRTIPHEDM